MLFFGSSKKDSWPFPLIHFVLLRLVIVVCCLVVTLSSNPSRVKFAIKGLMRLP
jgi:hypothetical protein